MCCALLFLIINCSCTDHYYQPEREFKIKTQKKRQTLACRKPKIPQLQIPNRSQVYTCILNLSPDTAKTDSFDNWSQVLFLNSSIEELHALALTSVVEAYSIAAVWEFHFSPPTHTFKLKCIIHELSGAPPSLALPDSSPF